MYYNVLHNNILLCRKYDARDIREKNLKHEMVYKWARMQTIQSIKLTCLHTLELTHARRKKELAKKKDAS